MIGDNLKKIWPYLVSLGSASIMILAFFLPSLQDQWDRYEARQVIKQYEKLGDEFFGNDQFEMAEEAFAKAFELSEQKRLDLEVKRLNAKVNRIGNDPTWGTKAPEGLQEIDFQFLLHFQKGQDKIKNRVSTLNCYGVFLASEEKNEEAEQVFKNAIKLDSTDVLAFVNLGNLYFNDEKIDDARKYYLKAISLDPQNARAHYNLGLLYVDQKNMDGARKEFSDALKFDPDDDDAKAELDSIAAPGTGRKH
jgi:tetratricopeptide (TPR) repeat protein